MSVMEKLTKRPVRAKVLPANTPPILPLDTLLQGDCIAIMRTLPTASVDMIFADPPYAKQSGGRPGPHANRDSDRWKQRARKRGCPVCRLWRHPQNAQRNRSLKQSPTHS